MITRPDGTREFRNCDIVNRLMYYQPGQRAIGVELLNLFTTVLLDLMDDLDKGDSLTLNGVGVFQISLEKQRWIYMPNFPGKSKFRRSHPKKWRLEFTPSPSLKHYFKAKCPDDEVVYIWRNKDKEKAAE